MQAAKIAMEESTDLKSPGGLHVVFLPILLKVGPFSNKPDSQAGRGNIPILLKSDTASMI